MLKYDRRLREQQQHNNSPTYGYDIRDVRGARVKGESNRISARVKKAKREPFYSGFGSVYIVPHSVFKNKQGATERYSEIAEHMKAAEKRSHPNQPFRYLMFGKDIIFKDGVYHIVGNYNGKHYNGVVNK